MTIPSSFRLGCIVRGEPGSVHFNALRFATSDECEAYGRDLYSRWTMLVSFEIHRSTDPVTHRMVDGHAFALASLEGGEGVPDA
jgi:hypothetical protein